ncbi:hypothetical protein H5T54_02745 [Candidatus Bipolaricaulota bacterium]|nr:hypothetical protein [Candidatus Bipolaricaulota bacterium]
MAEVGEEHALDLTQVLMVVGGAAGPAEVEPRRVFRLRPTRRPHRGEPGEDWR